MNRLEKCSWATLVSEAYNLSYPKLLHYGLVNTYLGIRFSLEVVCLY